MAEKITRRELMRLSAGTLLALGLWPGRLRADNLQDTSGFTFLAVNDLHFANEECGPWFEKAVSAMKASAPEAEFCLLCGDLADSGEAAQHVPVRDIFEKLGVPVYAAIGNHDYLTRTDRRSYEEVFKNQINYIIEHGGWQLVGIDTTEGDAWQDTKISRETFAWLDENLPKLDQRRPTILFTHFPLGAEVPMRPLNADEVLARFLEFNLGAVLCGHFHGYTERRLGTALMTTGRCCARVRANHDGSKEKGWFVCRAAASGEVTREFIEFKPSP
jgi:Icc-related predicted phosphoesterase